MLLTKQTQAWKFESACLATPFNHFGLGSWAVPSVLHPLWSLTQVALALNKVAPASSCRLDSSVLIAQSCLHTLWGKTATCGPRKPWIAGQVWSQTCWSHPSYSWVCAKLNDVTKTFWLHILGQSHLHLVLHSHVFKVITLNTSQLATLIVLNPVARYQVLKRFCKAFEFSHPLVWSLRL